MVWANVCLWVLISWVWLMDFIIGPSFFPLCMDESISPFCSKTQSQKKKKNQRGNGSGKSSLGSAVVTTGDIRDRKRKEAWRSPCDTGPIHSFPISQAWLWYFSLSLSLCVFVFMGNKNYMIMGLIVVFALGAYSTRAARRTWRNL